MVNTKGESIIERWVNGERRKWHYSPTGGFTNLGEIEALIFTEEGYVAGTNADDKGFLWHLDLGMREFVARLEDGHWLGICGANNHGQVVGDARFPSCDYRHAFLYDMEIGMIDLGTLGERESTALSISDQGIVIGNAYVNDRDDVGFIWDEKHGMRNLNSVIPRHTGWSKLRPIGINRDGFIVGEGSYLGVSNYFLLRPSSKP